MAENKNLKVLKLGNLTIPYIFVFPHVLCPLGFRCFGFAVPVHPRALAAHCSIPQGITLHPIHPHLLFLTLYFHCLFPGHIYYKLILFVLLLFMYLTYNRIKHSICFPHYSCNSSSLHFCLFKKIKCFEFGMVQ